MPCHACGLAMVCCRWHWLSGCSSGLFPRHLLPSVRDGHEPWPRQLSDNCRGGFWHITHFCTHKRPHRYIHATQRSRAGSLLRQWSRFLKSQPINPISCVWFMKTEHRDPGNEGLAGSMDSSNKRGDGSSVLIVAGSELARGTWACLPLCTPSKQRQRNIPAVKGK